MAIAFARCEYKSRAKGGSATRSAAYNSRGRVEDQRTGETFDFKRHKQAGDIHLGVLLPQVAPEGFRDPAALWNAAEAAEKRKDAQVAREVVLALPKELGPEDWKALTLAFARQHFVSRGLAVQVDIHAPDEDNPNPHAHILITTRRLTATGFEPKKARDLDPEITATKRGGKSVDGDRWGVLWCDAQNAYFKAQGLTLRVDPTQAKAEKHLGPKRHRGPEDSAPKAEAAAVEAENAAAWRDPAAILEMMTRTQPTFRVRDLDRALRKNIADREERAAVKAAVLAHADLVHLFDRTTGFDTGRLTTRQVQDEERQVVTDAAALAGDRMHRVDAAAVGAAISARTMRQDQLTAFHHALNAGGLAVIQGRAGVGKTYTLGALADVYRRTGCTVVALVPQHSQKIDLQADANMTAAHRIDVLHRELHRVESGKAVWTPKTVLLVDEAGMADTAIVARLMKAARAAGAKVVLTGDDRQLQSVSRGGMFPLLADRYDAAEITQVTRQKVEWQRDAAEDLAGGRMRAAMTAFNDHGAITWTDDMDGAVGALVDRWAADTLKRPTALRMVLAYTNDDVHRLNAALRVVRAERGELGYDVMLNSEGQRRAFAVADRVQIIKTDKKLDLYNGEVGTVQKIDGTKITLKLDSGRVVTWDSAQFDSFRHGYAGTVYKSQGRTLDETYLLHSKFWRQESTYVALTRQKHAANVFVAREVAADIEELVRQVSRSDDRRAAATYCGADEAALIQRAWEAAAEKVAQAEGFATGRPVERVRSTRSRADLVSGYLHARGEAGELWAEIQGDGCAGSAQDHPAYEAFQAAQERRHAAVRSLAADPVAVAALRAAGIVDALEVAADHLMATGVKRRDEAWDRAEDHAVALRLLEPPRPVVERSQDRDYDHGPSM